MNLPRTPGALAGYTAMAPDALDELRRRAAAGLPPELLARVAPGGAFRAEEPDGTVPGTGGILRVTNGVGVIDLRGALFKASGTLDDMVMRFVAGGTAYDDVWRALEACRTQNLKAALLRCASPGGIVDGCGELSDFIYALRGKLRIWAYVESKCASACYWQAAQAERIIAHDTALVGWVGIVGGPLIDDSALLEKLGVKKIEILSKHAKSKRSIPMDDEVIARAQVIADDLGDQFEADVARGRGVSPADVAARFGDGDGMIASKALAAGLIDAIGNFDSTLAALVAATTQHVPVPVSTGRAPATRSAVVPIRATTTRPRATMAIKTRSGHRAEADDMKDKQAKALAEADEKESEAKAKRAEAKMCRADADQFDKDDKKDDAKAKRAEADKMDEEAKAMDEEAKAIRAEHEEPDGDETEAKAALAAMSGLKPGASLAAHAAAIEAKMTPRDAVAALEKRLAGIEKERDEERAAAQQRGVDELIARAEAAGYFAGLDEAKTKVKRERLAKIASREPEAAEEIVASLPGARALGRSTANGNPLSGKHSAQPKIDAFDEGLGGRRVARGDVEVVEKGSPDLLSKAQAFAATNKVGIEEAMVAVVRGDSSLMK